MDGRAGRTTCQEDRMTFKVLLAAALAVTISAPALAADKAKDKSTEAPAKEKNICRTETVTGSLIAKRRICMTKAEWDKVTEANRQTVDKFTSQQTSRPGGQTNPAAPR
jgi:hypothetical protein